jgi:hypothetical protein
MSSQMVAELGIGLVVLCLLIFRQLQSRPVRASQRLLLILLVAGLVETSSYLERVHAGSVAVAALAGSLVLAVVFWHAAGVHRPAVDPGRSALDARQSADRRAVGGDTRRAPGL